MEGKYENVEWFVLSHGVQGVPVKAGLEPAQYEVMMGAGLDVETFEKLVNDEEIQMRFQMFCDEYATSPRFSVALGFRVRGLM